MSTGAITGYIDVAQLVLYAFWIFFAGLILYLRSEDKREGYPLHTDGRTGELVEGFPPMPAPKTFHLRDGSVVTAPSVKEDTREVRALPAARFPGAPLHPTGDALVDAVGPAAYAERFDTPDLTIEGQPKIVPLRVATDFYLEERDPDPRGMTVLGADRNIAGTVADVWVDRSEVILRFLEVTLADGSRSVLVPSNLVRIDRRRGEVRVKSVLAGQFASAPATAGADQVTLLEEDRIYGYFGGGHLYAVPMRTESML